MHGRPSSLGTPRVIQSTSGTCKAEEAQDEQRVQEAVGGGGGGCGPGGGPSHLVSWWVPRQRTVQYRAPQLTQV